jgi:hypothetical protein
VAAGPGAGGDVWVADGYGQSLVHRYSAAGEYRQTLDGTVGPGRFDCPHAVAFDPRGQEPTLLVADRGNALVHRFDLDGGFIGSIGKGALSTPSAFAFAGDLLVVAELRSRLALFDVDDRLIGYLGDGGEVWQEHGWPNRKVDGVIEPRTDRPAGRFSSPHGVAATPSGTIHVTEWRLGGRLVALEPVPA